jgi:hypothetical protein
MGEQATEGQVLYQYGLLIWDKLPVKIQEMFLRAFNCDLGAKEEWRKDTEHRRPKVPRTHATLPPVRRRWLRRSIPEPHLYDRSVSVAKAVDGTHREIFLVNRCMSTVLSGGDDLYEKENGGPVFQQPTTSAHQLLQRLDAFLPTIPGCNPKVGMTNEDIDKFFIVFGPTKDLLEYALNNRPSEEDRK